MQSIFTITTQDIQCLSDEQSRELVARLCRAELRENGISQASVTWGGDQRAKDGGVDVRVDVDTTPGISGYIKKDHSAFQVKAEKFPKGKIAGEMAPKGALRPAIEDLAKINGAYIIVSTRDSVSASSLSVRVMAMGECLAGHGLAGKVVVDFYDCRKIADWVEQHPAIAVWIRQVLCKPLVGWQPYAPWAYQETEIEAEYLIDARVKVFIPNADDGSDVLSAINSLRGDLSKKASVRIVGLSGVGKTRLAQALFDKRIFTERVVLDADNVLYTDLSSNPTPQPRAMVEALVSDGADCVVVVDNCGPDVHKSLTEVVKRLDSKVRLVTIEYDIRDDLPEGSVCYRLEGSSDEVIKELLKRRFNILSEGDLDKIVEFSDGNARVAFALASTTEVTGELGRLHDADLFARLFHQKHAENDELLRCAEAASLLYSFDGEDDSENSEMAILASFSEVSIITFRRFVVELQRRGLVQARAEWRAVLPHAISNRLAARAVESLPRTRLIEDLIEHGPDRVARSFSRRLSYLHESKPVCEIVQGWLKPNGRYGDLINLGEVGRQVFTNIAPVHQEATLQALERAIVNSDFVSVGNRNRSCFARVARLLAYESVFFDRAVKVLERFVLAEPEGHNNDSTHDLLKSLFSCELSGTEASPEQRSAIVREFILSENAGKQKFGFLLLESALETDHFSSSYDFGFGARRRGFGWSPRTSDDVHSWYKPFIAFAVEVGKNDSVFGKDVRSLLGQHVRNLWCDAGLRKAVVMAAKELSVIDGWPEGWIGARSTLRWDKERINEDSLQELLELERTLAPRDLKSEITAKVLARGAFADDLNYDDDTETPGSQYRRFEQEIEGLGKAAAIETTLLSELLPSLLSNYANGSTRTFGFGVGQEVYDATEVMVQARGLVASAEPNSICLMFLRGFISGWREAKPQEVRLFLDDALHDDVWGRFFAELQLQVALDDKGYNRLLKSLELGNTPISQYQGLAYGRAAFPLTVEQISTLINAIKSHGDDGFVVAAEILSMVIYSAKERDDDYCQGLAVTCTLFLLDLDWLKVLSSKAGASHRIETILKFALSMSHNGETISDILQKLVGALRTRKTYFSRRQGGLFAPFFKYYPKETLDAVYVADDNGRNWLASQIVSRVGIDLRETAICEVPIEVLLEWCEVSPEDRYLFAAQTCRLFAKESSGGGEDESSLELSDEAIQILSGARDKKEVLHVFVARFSPMSGSGSLSAKLKKRLPLLAKLNLTDGEALGLEIARAEESFIKRIEEEEAREEERERSQTGSFE